MGKIQIHKICIISLQLQSNRTTCKIVCKYLIAFLQHSLCSQHISWFVREKNERQAIPPVSLTTNSANRSDSVSTLYLSRIIWMTSLVWTRLVIQTDMHESFGGVNTDVSRSYLKPNVMTSFLNPPDKQESPKWKKWFVLSMTANVLYHSVVNRCNYS